MALVCDDVDDTIESHSEKAPEVPTEDNHLQIVVEEAATGPNKTNEEDFTMDVEIPPPVTLTSDNNKPDEATTKPKKTKEEEDLEDGEIDDDDDDDVPMEPVAAPPVASKEPADFLISSSAMPPMNLAKNVVVLPEGKEMSNKEKKREEKRRHKEKETKRMTEAEKSILHLRKRERMQREKWEKFRKDQNLVEPPVVDDFAINLEKAIASVLKKDSRHSGTNSDDDKEDLMMDPMQQGSKRGRKRKRNNKSGTKGNSSNNNNNNKHRRLATGDTSPPPKGVDDYDDFSSDPPLLRGRSDSPLGGPQHRNDDSDDSYSSSDYSNKSDELNKRRQQPQQQQQQHFNNSRKKNRNNRNKNKNSSNVKHERERRAEQQLKDAQGVCVFFLQGKCQKNDCPYSHEAVPPMKLELCKFYLMDCCAKGEKCSYMHSEFPCKFYHTGLPCLQGDNCKFAHGKPLSEGLKQILFKHIETAPREILGGFPRMNREEALTMINSTQLALKTKYGEVEEFQGGNNVPIPPELMMGEDFAGTASSDAANNRKRNRPSRWQDPEPQIVNVAEPPPNYKPQIQTTMPNLPQSQQQQFNFTAPPTNLDQDMRISALPVTAGDVDMRTLPPPNLTTMQGNDTDTDIRLQLRPQTTIDPRILASADVDIRQIPQFTSTPGNLNVNAFSTPSSSGEATADPLADMPKIQRDLYMRLQQQQQKTTLPTTDASVIFDSSGGANDSNINWYSDDDDEDRLTIKVDCEDDPQGVKKDESPPPPIKPQEVVDKLGDLSKIDISAEVTKLLTSMTQQQQQPPVAKSRDPRCQQRVRTSLDEPTPSSSSNKQVSIYEQGSISIASPDNDNDSNDDDLSRGARPDVDLRNLTLPFKGISNYTPAKEIDASINSHPPMMWEVAVVEIPRPDYSGLKLNVQEAEKTGDPRLRKIFRLSVDEKDSPMSPKASPKARIDPRLRKNEEKPSTSVSEGPLSYSQQLSILQSSAFFQSLTTNQKVLLTQELASRSAGNEQSSNSHHDPILNSVLSNLNLIQPTTNAPQSQQTTAMSILSSVNKLNPALLATANPLALGLGGANAINPNLMVSAAPSMIMQPGLLGAAPGIPNEFIAPPQQQMAGAFDPRTAAMMGFGGGAQGGFNQEFYNNSGEEAYYGDFNRDNNRNSNRNFGGGGGNGSNNSNNNRDRRRNNNRNNFNNNSSNNNNNNRRNNFRNNNRNRNKSHSPVN